jgi:hypothetical protein
MSHHAATITRRRHAATHGRRALTITPAICPPEPAEGAVLWVPGEDLWLVHDKAKPSAVADRAELARDFYNSAIRLYDNAAAPWVGDYLYHLAEAPPGANLTPAMEAFRCESTLKAICRAAVRPTEQLRIARVKRGRLAHVPVSLVTHYLERLQAWPAVRHWIRCGQQLPGNFTVASADQCRRAGLAFDWMGHLLRTELTEEEAATARGRRPSIGSYARWVGAHPGQAIGDVQAVKWLFGFREPEGVYVVGLKLQRLRPEMTLEAAARAAGVAPSTARLWRADADLGPVLNRAFAMAEPTAEAIIAQHADLDRQVAARIAALAVAAKPRACRDRAGFKWSETARSHYEYQQCLSEARRAGALAELKAYLGEYLPGKPAYDFAASHQTGRVAPHLLVASPAFSAFRRVSGQALTEHGGHELARLPHFELWFRDLATPRREGGPAAALPITPAAALPITPAAAEQPAPSARGRKRDPETARMQERCHGLYTSPGKLSTALRALEREFGARAPKEKSHLRRNAQRHARATGLPKPCRP